MINDIKGIIIFLFQLFKTRCFLFIDSIYALILSLFRKLGHRNVKMFSLDDLNIIKKIDSGFSQEWSGYEDLHSVNDFANFHCCKPSQIECFINDSYYIIAIRRFDGIYIADCTSVNGKCSEIFKIINFLAKNYLNKTFFTRAREKTSYPLYLAFQKRGKITILRDKVQIIKNEKFHSLKFKANPEKWNIS